MYLTPRLDPPDSFQVMIESVSFVGVDLNRAPVHVLRRIAGLGPATAKAIVERRSKLGSAGFASR